MNIVIASDHAGFELKETLKQEIKHLGFEVKDLGTNDTQSVDYPDFANALADWLKTHTGDKGVLICGSGIGISIAANRHKHVRAALVTSPEGAALSRQHNDANVLCLGSRLTSMPTAKECVNAFLTTEFEGGRHAGRVAKLSSC
jgi:ribose 5-phosphate isomerase B